VLVPSVFCVGRPWVFWDVRDESLPRLLVYPVLRSFDDAVTLWARGAPPGDAALARLLGPTRARALDAVADACITTELARRLGVSPATASHHAGVLRDAQLIGTSRDGNAVRHRLTELGIALLRGTGNGAL
jgi:DNA-binding transcriptional ArsR family regulator